jgi:hypothetical protein
MLEEFTVAGLVQRSIIWIDMTIEFMGRLAASSSSYHILHDRRTWSKYGYELELTTVVGNREYKDGAFHVESGPEVRVGKPSIRVVREGVIVV